MLVRILVGLLNRRAGISALALTAVLLSVAALTPGPAFADKGLTITFAGTGGGSVALVDTTDGTRNMTCTATCTVAVGNNDVGTLTATANGVSTFIGWSAQTAGITGCLGNTCNFSMGNATQSVTVTFDLAPTATRTPTSTP